MARAQVIVDQPGFVDPARADAYKLVLEVVPFSAQEREAAAAWVSQSLGEGATLGPEEANDFGARILGTIVATSFKRRVLQRFSYKGDIGSWNPLPK